MFFFDFAATDNLDLEYQRDTRNILEIRVTQRLHYAVKQ